MGSTLSPEEQRLMKRVADEPFYWVRENCPEVKRWDDEFYDLVDNIKDVWEQCRVTRVDLCFILKLDMTTTSSTTKTIQDYTELQKKQNLAHSHLVFEIDIVGKVIDEIDMKEEIEQVSVMILSRTRNAVVFWLGPDLEIFCHGLPWTPKKKAEILKDIKLRKRDRLQSMENYPDLLKTHYEQYLLAAGVNYWFEGRKNEVLVPKPEKKFQHSLFMFLRDSVEGVVDHESMFKDYSRCDVRVLQENFDIYFIEIKWIGYCAVKKKGEQVISAENPTEVKVESAVAGALQTKIYIDKNNHKDYDNRIRMGIVVVYDAYPVPKTINYPKEVREHPLIDTLQFPLVTDPPSVVSKAIVKAGAAASRKTAKKASKKAAAKTPVSKTTKKAKKRSS